MSTDIEHESGASEELIGMSKEQALEYLGLKTDANDFEIDDKFWQLSKRARGIEDDKEREQKIIDITYAYDVATGKEEARIKALKEREAEPKFLGKTKAEWKNYFGYTWYKYLIVLLIIVCAVLIVKRVVFTPEEDIGMLSVGHFSVDTDIMDARLRDYGFKNPYVVEVDLAVPNDQGQSTNIYASQSSQVLFLSNPEIVVTDEATMLYFFGNLSDMSSYYDELKEELPEETLSKITPIYYSEYEAELNSIEYQKSQGAEEIDYSDLEAASQEKILCGLEIKDTELMTELGYKNLWPKSEATLIFSIGVNGDNKEEAQKFLTTILKEVS